MVMKDKNPTVKPTPEESEKSREAYISWLSWKDMPIGYRDLPPEEQKKVWKSVEERIRSGYKKPIYWPEGY